GFRCGGWTTDRVRCGGWPPPRRSGVCGGTAGTWTGSSGSCSASAEPTHGPARGATSGPGPTRHQRARPEAPAASGARRLAPGPAFSQHGGARQRRAPLVRAPLVRAPLVRAPLVRGPLVPAVYQGKTKTLCGSMALLRSASSVRDDANERPCQSAVSRLRRRGRLSPAARRRADPAPGPAPDTACPLGARSPAGPSLVVRSPTGPVPGGSPTAPSAPTTTAVSGSA